MYVLPFREIFLKAGITHQSSTGYSLLHGILKLVVAFIFKPARVITFQRSTVRAHAVQAKIPVQGTTAPPIIPALFYLQITILLFVFQRVSLALSKSFCAFHTIPYYSNFMALS